MAASRDDRFFASIAQHPSETSAGPCDMPILYRDASLQGMFYRVDPARAAACLPADGPFEPFRIFGKALVLLVVFEYRETTVGVYNELGLAIQVKRRGTKPSLLRFATGMKTQQDTGLYVVNLPVTTEAARAAGVELWGFPKYVTPIETRFDDAGFRCALGDELVVTSKRGKGLKMGGLPFITYTQHQGRLLRTVVEVGHTVRYGAARTVEVEVTGVGPTAATVKTLGLDETRCWTAFRTDAMRAILPHGVDMGADPTASASEVGAAA